MAFPDVIVEIAFANDIDEALYASAGWTDVTDFVISVSGRLRGRPYELDTPEAGSLTIELDNSDRRFTMDLAESPYFPNVRSNRRIRIRGKNMVHPNIATGGAKDRSIVGFFRPPSGTFSIEGVSEPVLGRHASLSGLPNMPRWTYTDDDGSEVVSVDLNGYHAAVTVESGAQGRRHLLAWFAPVEIGVRLTHSAYVWKADGPPADDDLRLELYYFDNEGNELIGEEPRPTGSLSGSPNTPVRLAISHAPPGTTKYAFVVLSANFPTATTSPVTYAVTGVQTELETTNLAPNPSAQYDVRQWYPNDGSIGLSRDPANNALLVEWEDGSESVWTVIPRLVPGRTYTAVAEVRKNGGPAVSLSVEGTDARDVLTTDDEWEQMQLTFVARTPEMELRWSAVEWDEDTQSYVPSSFEEGQLLRVRKLRVTEGPTVPPLGSDSPETTEWEFPKAIFEGWVERFPLSVRSPGTTVSVVAVDRFKRLGAIELNSTHRETLFEDGCELILPLSEIELDDTGGVANVGTWAEQGMWSVPMQRTLGDLGTSEYLFSEEGPTTAEGALWLKPASINQGFFFVVGRQVGIRPEAPPPPPSPPSAPPPSEPPPPKQKKRYTKKYYATWSQSYRENGTQINYPGEVHQGHTSAQGHKRGLIGFDDAKIRSDLEGATIISCSVSIRMKYWYWNAGGTLYIGTHDYSSKPSTWSGSRVNERRWTQKYTQRYNQWKTKSLGVTAGKEFKSGKARGIAIGPAPSASNDYYGYAYGAGTGDSKPYLTIVYEK